MTIRVRFAPSPTGNLHIGGARTALFNYLLAKKLKGTFIIRIEDTDLARNIDKADQKFLENLRWLGLHWDEGPDIGGIYGPYKCTERLSIYENHIEQLVKEGKAYACYCSEQELEKEREEQLNRGLTPRYSGKCLHLTEDQKKQYEFESRSKVIRFHVLKDKSILFKDDVRGDMEFDSTEIGDFIIVKSDGIPTYSFAVAIDDHLMKISHVIRGEEHLSNTPRQIIIFDAFGWEKPNFVHLPLILNPTGKKLSKRDESIIQFIEQYRNMGFLPEAMINFLALLGWSPEGEQELLSLEEIIEKFTLDRISKSGAIFDMNKLVWLNKYYMKQASLHKLVNLFIESLHKQERTNILDMGREWISTFTSLYRERVGYIAELPNLAKPFLNESIEYSDNVKDFLKQDYVPIILSSFLVEVKKCDEWNSENITAIFKHIQKETGFKGRHLFSTIRSAVFGEIEGADLKLSLELLEQKKVISRLNSLS